MGKANGRYVHGNLTCEAISQRRLFRALMRSAQKAIEMVDRT